jgi:hypothetical protein
MLASILGTRSTWRSSRARPVLGIASAKCAAGARSGAQFVRTAYSTLCATGVRRCFIEVCGLVLALMLSLYSALVRLGARLDAQYALGRGLA